MAACSPTLRLLLLALFLTGCEAAQYVSRGDDALKQGRPQTALVNYKAAARSDPNLQRDPVFRAKLIEATWRTSLEDAESAARQGGWEVAIRHYEESLRHNPNNPPAVDGLAKAKVEGAREWHVRAVAAADKGDLAKAKTDLDLARTWDPGNKDVNAALASLQRGGGPVEPRYSATLRLMEEKRHDQAAGELAAIIAADANHLPARAALFRANGQLAESRRHHEQASRLLEQKRLDDALAAAGKALDLWPGNADAADLMARAKAQRDQAEALLAQSKQLAAQNDFAGATAAVGQCLAVYPFHAEAIKWSSQIKQAAADTYTAAGQQKLQANDLEGAASAFRAALGYVASHRPASDGLVQVAFAQGQGAEKENLWGNALLWYMDAASQRPDGIYKEAERRARDELNRRIAFELATVVADGRGQSNVDTAALEGQLSRQLARIKPPFVNLTAAGGAPPAGAARLVPNPEPDPAAPALNVPPTGPLYRAAVTMRSIQVGSQLISRDRKTHEYTAYRAVANPAIPGLEHDLAHAERELRVCRGRLIQYRCNPCGGQGRIACSTCTGSRSVACGGCAGRGTIRLKAGGYQQCSACRGAGRAPCTACRGAGSGGCSRCGGKGVFFDHDHGLIRARERDVADLRYRLSREPVTIREKYLVQWPYEQEVHRKTGDLDSSVRLENAAGELVQAFDVKPSFSATDTVTLNPNPTVGLPADELTLPTDEAAYRALIDDAASGAATNIVTLATVARANAFIAAANDHAKAGKTDLDIEARVAAMVLLEPVRPAEAKRLLDEIRNPKR